MAEGLLKHFLGRRLYVDSVGVRPGGLNPFAVEVMREIGIDLTNHEPKLFSDLVDDSFDLVVTLSPESHHRALELTRTTAWEVEYWPMADPTLIQGNRDIRLASFRQVRDDLTAQIRQRFGATEALRSPSDG